MIGQQNSQINIIIGPNLVFLPLKDIILTIILIKDIKIAIDHSYNISSAPHLLFFLFKKL